MVHWFNQNQTMLLQIQLLRYFIQADRKHSLQAQLLNTQGATSDHQKAYQEIVRISDKIKYKARLTPNEKLHAARYYRSLTNEIKGKTLRYGTETTTKKNSNNQ